MASEVGRLYRQATLTAPMSNVATRRNFLVTDVNSVTTSGASEYVCTSSQEISFSIPPLLPPTLMGNVLMTMHTLSTCRGDRPTSEANADAVVSLAVT